MNLTGWPGPNFRHDPDLGDVAWDCHHNFRNSASILARMGLAGDEIEATFEFFVREGSHCDCEVLLNLTASAVCVQA